MANDTRDDERNQEESSSPSPVIELSPAPPEKRGSSSVLGGGGSKRSVSSRASIFLWKSKKLSFASSVQEDKASSSLDNKNNDQGGGNDSDDEDEEAIDRKRINRSVRDAGKYSDGISAVEVWTLSSDGRELVRPDGGWWRDPNFETSDDESAKEALARLEDDARDDHVGAAPLMVGTGLAGKLWAESSSSSGGGGAGAGRTNLYRRKSNAALNPTVAGAERVKSDGDNGKKEGEGESNATKAGQRNLFAGLDEDLDEVASSSSSISNEDDASFNENGSDVETGDGNGPDRRPSFMKSMLDQPDFDFRRSMMEESKKINVGTTRRGLSLSGRLHLPIVPHLHHQPTILWRNLASLSSDPDQPTFLRLKLLEDAGFSQAAGVPFEARGGRKGIVVYLAKADVDKKQLTVPANAEYILQASDLIGMAATLTASRKKSVESREDRRKRMDGTVACDQGDADDPLKNESTNFRCLGSGSSARKIRIWASKCRGGNLQPPPPMATSQSILTFFGACSTLLLLGYTSDQISSATDGEYGLILAPFGALMMLQYGLVMAPASQPRSAMLGQIVSLTIALLFSYISEESMPKYVRVSLATATAVSAMARLGVVHPPAAAAAAVVSGGVGGAHDWLTIPLFLLGNTLAVCTATMINNFSDKRQYPTFWGVSVWLDRIVQLLSICLPRSMSSSDDGDNGSMKSLN